ncbi:phage tail tape measure protein [Noviherbaspirillum cavernae]|uniref:Phage tail tape measure protein n=2 Tax=Noviherbaspirillum cavernae TaxID=2320862 RepID=A0A418WW11_9BURK|nr:phage tail tape measure protein [Noviherbaspirillum cavernae]
MAQGFQKLYQQLNGFSAVSKLAVAAGGYSILSDALRRNLEFEKTILDMKQTAQMTVKEAAEMRRYAIDIASDNLALPTEIAAGMKAFSAAGMKFDQIKPSIEEAARAAVAFRATVEQMADLDFDLQDKLKLDPRQIKDAHNMLLFHAKSGRYEAGPMAMEAPKYLNSAAAVGIKGIGGLNFTGAMTQILMKLAPKTQPAEVSTFMEHGFGHISSDRYVKGLAKFGIDVKKYMPNGKFYGEYGVDGITDLAAEMKRKGLDNPFKLDAAGFRDMYTKKFWKQLMDYLGDVKTAVKSAEKQALDDMVGSDKAETMNSNFGKIKQALITKEKAQLSDPATSAVTAWAKLNGWVAENPATAIAGGAAAYTGWRLLKNRIAGAGSSVLGNAASGIGGAGMPVTITNWPAGFGGPMKPSDRLSQLPGKPLASAGSAATGVLAAGAIKSTVAGAAVVAAPLALAYASKKFFESETGQRGRARALDLEVQRLEARLNLQKGPGYQDKQMTEQLQRQIDQRTQARDVILSRLDTLANRPVQVVLDGRVIAESVNRVNGRDAGRR